PFLRRPPTDRLGPRVPPAMAAAAWPLGLAIVCSLATTYRQLTPFEAQYTRRILIHSYFQVADWIGAGAGMRFAEGLALAAATMCVFRQRPSLAVSLPIALAAGASA